MKLWKKEILSQSISNETFSVNSFAEFSISHLCRDVIRVSFLEFFENYIDIAKRYSKRLDDCHMMVRFISL